MKNKNTQRQIDLLINRIKRLYGEKYHTRINMESHYFPGYDRWIIVYDDAFMDVKLTTQELKHLQQWIQRYYTKQVSKHNQLIMVHEQWLATELVTLELQHQEELQAC